MAINTIKIYYNLDGTINHQSNDAIVAESNATNQLQIIAPFSNQTAVTANFQLSNGIIITAKPTMLDGIVNDEHTNDEDWNKWVYTLGQDVLGAISFLSAVPLFITARFFEIITNPENGAEQTTVIKNGKKAEVSVQSVVPSPFPVATPDEVATILANIAINNGQIADINDLLGVDGDNFVKRLYNLNYPIATTVQNDDLLALLRVDGSTHSMAIDLLTSVINGNDLGIFDLPNLLPDPLTNPNLDQEVFWGATVAFTGAIGTGDDYVGRFLDLADLQAAIPVPVDNQYALTTEVVDRNIYIGVGGSWVIESAATLNLNRWQWEPQTGQVNPQYTWYDTGESQEVDPAVVAALVAAVEQLQLETDNLNDKTQNQSAIDLETSFAGDVIATGQAKSNSVDVTFDITAGRDITAGNNVAVGNDLSVVQDITVARNILITLSSGEIISEKLLVALGRSDVIAEVINNANSIVNLGVIKQNITEPTLNTTNKDMPASINELLTSINVNATNIATNAANIATNTNEIANNAAAINTKIDGLDIEDSAVPIASSVANISFGANLNVTDLGSGQVEVSAATIATARAEVAATVPYIIPEFFTKIPTSSLLPSNNTDVIDIDGNGDLVVVTIGDYELRSNYGLENDNISPGVFTIDILFNGIIQDGGGGTSGEVNLQQIINIDASSGGNPAFETVSNTLPITTLTASTIITLEAIASNPDMRLISEARLYITTAAVQNPADMTTVVYDNSSIDGSGDRIAAPPNGKVDECDFAWSGTDLSSDTTEGAIKEVNTKSNTNQSNITANASNIATNSTNIAINTGAISTIESDIATNNTRFGAGLFRTANNAVASDLYNSLGISPVVVNTIFKIKVPVSLINDLANARYSVDGGVTFNDIKNPVDGTNITGSQILDNNITLMYDGTDMLFLSSTELLQQAVQTSQSKLNNEDFKIINAKDVESPQAQSLLFYDENEKVQFAPLTEATENASASGTNTAIQNVVQGATDDRILTSLMGNTDFTLVDAIGDDFEVEVAGGSGDISINVQGTIQGNKTTVDKTLTVNMQVLKNGSPIGGVFAIVLDTSEQRLINTLLVDNEVGIIGDRYSLEISTPAGFSNTSVDILEDFQFIIRDVQVPSTLKIQNAYLLGDFDVLYAGADSNVTEGTVIQLVKPIEAGDMLKLVIQSASSPFSSNFLTKVVEVVPYGSVAENFNNSTGWTQLNTARTGVENWGLLLFIDLSLNQITFSKIINEQFGDGRTIKLRAITRTGKLGV